MDFQIGLIIAGLTVGFIVGLTGVGGGSLMTPILLWFNIPPSTAVGTDLLYAAFTKTGGIYAHNKKSNINWVITGWLSLGSIPAALLTLWILHSIKTDVTALNAIIKHSLGWALLFTSIAIVFKKRLLVFSQKHAGDKFHSESKTQNLLTVAIGVMLGAMDPDFDWSRCFGNGNFIFLVSPFANSKTGWYRNCPCCSIDSCGWNWSCLDGKSGLWSIGTVVNRISSRDLHRQHVERKSSRFVASKCHRDDVVFRGL